MMSKLQELIESHKPKNFKYYIKLHKDEDYVQLEKDGFDMDTLDTIRDPDLIHTAIDTTYRYYDRKIVASAKKPTIMENGVILSKKMATKTDKKLYQVGVGFFQKDGISYVAVKLDYENFDIYEIFILT